MEADQSATRILCAHCGSSAPPVVVVEDASDDAFTRGRWLCGVCNQEVGFFRGTDGQLNLGIVRDEPADQVNDFKMFEETFEGVVFEGSYGTFEPEQPQ